MTIITSKAAGFKVTTNAGAASDEDVLASAAATLDA